MVRLGLDPKNPNVLVWTAEADPSGNPAVWLEETLKAVTPTLIIADTLTDLVKIRHGASNAGYEDMTSKLGGLYAWAQARHAHLHLIHHGGKGVREGIETALGTVGIVSKPGTILDYRLMRAGDETSPRVLKGVKHREGRPVEMDLPAVVVDFDRERGLTVSGSKDDAAIREIGAAIIQIVAASPNIRQAEVEREVEGRKTTKLAALRYLTHPVNGVLVKEGTAGRSFPLRLQVRPDLIGDPVEIWRKPTARFASILGELVPSAQTNSTASQDGYLNRGRELVPTYTYVRDGNQLKKDTSEASDRVGSPERIEGRPEPSGTTSDVELF
jgi:hypothetical protein